jgi:hypothetical protein
MLIGRRENWVGKVGEDYGRWSRTRGGLKRIIENRTIK